MLEGWRICKAKHAATAFSGEGAALTGGRWNSRGVRVVYASASQSLAMLENLVHLNPAIIFRYVAFRLEFRASLVKDLSLTHLPSDWQVSPASPATQAIGDAWVKSAESVILSLPSVIVPRERNYLINPAHPDFAHLVIEGPMDFPVDPRLV